MSKRRYMHGKRRRRSPLRYDFTKSADYSPEATKGKIGDKIAKAVTPTGFVDMIPVGKIVKGVKAVHKFVKG